MLIFVLSEFYHYIREMRKLTNNFVSKSVSLDENSLSCSGINCNGVLSFHEYFRYKEVQHLILKPTL